MDKSLENAYALIIGISKYMDNRISELKYTHADAEEFSKLITDPERVGLKKENVRVLLDENATLSRIKESIVNWLIKKADEKSTVFIFFAGHGGAEADLLKREKDNLAKYLLPYDTNRDSLFSTALSNRDFHDFLQMIRSKKLIIFLDACHSGGVASCARDVKITEDPYQKLAEGEGQVVISASKHDQLSYEDANLGHGVFTYHLIDALSGKADANKDGYVTVSEVYNYLQEKVPASARDIANAEQEPVYNGENITKDFFISINQVQIKKKEKESIQEEKIRKLGEFYFRGEFSGIQYERLMTIIRTEDKKLTEMELKIGKLTDSLFEEDISIATFLDGLKYIEPDLFAKQKGGIPVKPDPIQSNDWINKDRERQEAEGRKKRIIELGLEANSLNGEGNHTLAITKWKEVLKLDPDYDEATKGIKESEKALKEIEKKKKQIDELTIEAKLLFKKEDYFGAIEKWTEILDIDPKNQIAKDGIKKAKSKTETETTILRLLKDAQRLSIEGNHALAIPKWREILDIEPENRKAIEGLRESERILREISELNVYAQRLYDEGMYNRALEKWNEVLKIDVYNKIALEGIALEGIENLKNTPTVKKYCTSCGQPNIRGVKFCTNCGANLIN